MMLILMMVMFSLRQVVLDSPPAENPPTENGTRSPVDHGYFWEKGLQVCPSTCETCESNTTCTLCKTKYYGQACQLKCNCNDDRCSKVAGVCPQGCPYGTYGTKCELKCCGSCEICHRNTGQCLQCYNNYSLHDGVCHDWFAANTTRTTNLDISTNLTETDASTVTTNKGDMACQIGFPISIFINIVAGIAMLLQKYPITTLNQWIRQKRTQRSCENNHSENHGKTEEGHRKCPLDGDSLKSKGFCRETKQANKETLKNEHKFELNENGTSGCVRIEMESEESQKNAEESHSSDDIVCNGEDPNNSILKLTGTEHLPVSHRPQSPSDNERLENPESTRSNQGSQFVPENEPLLPKHNLRGPDSTPFQATRLCTSLSKEEPHTSSNSIHKQESICPSDKSDNLEANKPLDASPKEGVLSKLKQDKTDQQMLQKEEGYILSVTKSNQQSTGTAQSTKIAQPTAMMSKPLIEDRRLTTAGTDCPASVDIKNEEKPAKFVETQRLRKNSLENANKTIPWPPDKNPPEKKLVGHQFTHI